MNYIFWFSFNLFLNCTRFPEYNAEPIYTDKEFKIPLVPNKFIHEELGNNFNNSDNNIKDDEKLTNEDIEILERYIDKCNFLFNKNNKKVTHQLSWWFFICGQ